MGLAIGQHWAALGSYYCIKRHFEKGGRIAQMDTVDALHPAALGSIFGIPEYFSLGVAEIY